MPETHTYGTCSIMVWRWSKMSSLKNIYPYAPYNIASHYIHNARFFWEGAHFYLCIFIYKMGECVCGYIVLLWHHLYTLLCIVCLLLSFNFSYFLNMNRTLIKTTYSGNVSQTRQGTRLEVYYLVCGLWYHKSFNHTEYNNATVIYL